MATEMSLAARLKHAHELEDHNDYEPAPEGAIVQAIEEEVAKMPSDTFLWAALSALGLSLALFNAGKKADAMFVGQLATPILALGLYRKLARNAGSDPVHP